MGTRNLTLVYYRGKYRIIQYGQWDGHPDGQGLTALYFLLDAINIADLQKVLDDSDTRIINVSEEQRNAYFAESSASKSKQKALSLFLPLNRCLAILEPRYWTLSLVPPEMKIHLWDMEFLNDEVFMEWAWVVNLDRKVLEAYTYWDRYKTMDEKSRFEDVLGSEKKLPGLVKRFGFDELPTYGRGFLEEFQALVVDAEE